MKEQRKRIRRTRTVTNHQSNTNQNENVAFLELKYGNIYGGYPNFYAISEIALLVFEYGSNKIFLESWINQADVDFVSVYSKVNELGHTVGRMKEVINMRTNRRKPFDEEFKLEENDLGFIFKKLHPSKMPIKSFLLKNMRKYRFRNLIVFDGRRDIFLCERTGVKFDHVNIIDIQKDLNKETDYLFSLNKLAVVTGFDYDRNYLRSNNLEYWLHPIAARQITPRSAAFDAARLMMIYNEYTEHHSDFLVKAQLLLNKIQTEKPTTLTPEKAESTEKTENPEKAESTEKTENPEKAESTEKTENPEKAESTEKTENPEKTT